MKSTLEAAAELIGGERARQHGDANELHTRVAKFWNAYIEEPFGERRYVDSKDVLMMMALLKIARTLHGAHNRDDYIDALGYIALAAHLADGDEA